MSEVLVLVFLVMRIGQLPSFLDALRGISSLERPPLLLKERFSPQDMVVRFVFCFHRCFGTPLFYLLKVVRA